MSCTMSAAKVLHFNVKGLTTLFLCQKENLNAESSKDAQTSETQAAVPTKPIEEPNVFPTEQIGGEEPVLSLPRGKVEEPVAPPSGEEETAENSVRTEEDESVSLVKSPSSENTELVEIPAAEEKSVSAAPSEKMPIPSVVIEPASSNEGDDDRDADIISPVAISDNGVNTEKQSIKSMSPSVAVSGQPVDFLYKVETMHDFEAANSDELELQRGDVVLVVPTASLEDQEAGWLTGFKESDWLTLGAAAQKGLFPENFTQRLQ